jgi:hypothetical protein
MPLWNDIENSQNKARILRYKSDLEALQKVVLALKQPHGLPELLIPIIEGTLQEVATLRAQLPPLSAWYMENKQALPQPQHPGPDVKVSDWNYREQRKACERTLDEVKERLEWLDGLLENWHVQETGKTNGKETLIWSNYKEGYNALMAPLENPNFSTDGSQSKLFSHNTMVCDSHSVAVMAEIDLLLEARAKVWKYCEFLEGIPMNVKSLKSMIYKLPSEYDLKTTRIYSVDFIERSFYRTRYEVYSFPSYDRISRPVVLSNTRLLLAFMRAQYKTVRDSLPSAEQSIHNSTEYERFYNETVSAFEKWIALARPLCMPSLAELRVREQGGRVPRKISRTGLLLERLCSLVE